MPSGMPLTPGCVAASKTLSTSVEIAAFVACLVMRVNAYGNGWSFMGFMGFPQ